MAGTDTEFTHLVDQTHKFASNLSTAEKSAEGLTGLFRQAAVYAGAYEVIKNAIFKAAERTEAYQRIQSAVSKENLSQTKLLSRELDLLNEQRNAEQNIRTTTGAIQALERRKLLDIQHQLELLTRQKVVALELEKVGYKSLGILALYKVAAFDLYVRTHEFNQNLIEANSSFEHRNRLLMETLMVQAQLGIGFDKVTHAAAALVHYGLDAETSFNDNVRLVAQMEQGLGVSVNASAQLASIVERQLKGSFQGVSNVIAQIVNDTALAGDEATKLAATIATALGRLRPGLGAAGLPEVVRLVGRYEGALKEVGGQAGGFQQLLTQLTSPEGLVGAGALGVSPEFLATSRGVEQVMERFSKFGEMLVGQSSGWERQMRLQALAQIFNTSADNANQMLIAIQRANAQQGVQISLQDRWREQLHATNAGVGRLANSLWALLQGAMSPVVLAVGALANALADGLEWILKSREIVYGVGIALGIGFIALTSRMWGLAKALWNVVVSSTAAQAALNRMSGAGATSALGGLFTTATFRSRIGRWLSATTSFLAPPGALGGSLWNWINTLPNRLSVSLSRIPMGGSGLLLRPLLLMARGIGLLLNPVGLLVTGIAILGSIGYKQYSEIRRLREEAKAQEQIIISKQEALEAQQRARFYAAARFGTSEDVSKAYASLLRDSTSLFTDIADPNARRARQQEWVNQQMASSQLDLAKAVMTSGMFTTLTERSPQEKKYEDDMATAGKKLLKVNENQSTVLEKHLEMKKVEIQEANDERAKVRAWRDPYSTAKEFYSDLFFNLFYR